MQVSVRIHLSLDLCRHYGNLCAVAFSNPFNPKRGQVAMDILLQFGHQYEVEQIRETSGSLGRTRKLFYPGASETGGKDGVLRRIVPLAGDTWVGSFAPGHPGHNSVNKVIAVPIPTTYV
jgi:hypothetical protein